MARARSRTLLSITSGPDGVRVAGRAGAPGELDVFAAAFAGEGTPLRAFSVDASWAGISARRPSGSPLIARYGHDGTLDESFGSGGLLLHDFRSGEAVCGPAEHE